MLWYFTYCQNLISSHCRVGTMLCFFGLNFLGSLNKVIRALLFGKKIISNKSNLRPETEHLNMPLTAPGCCDKEISCCHSMCAASGSDGRCSSLCSQLPLRIFSSLLLFPSPSMSHSSHTRHNFWPAELVSSLSLDFSAKEQPVSAFCCITHN